MLNKKIRLALFFICFVLGTPMLYVLYTEASGCLPGTRSLKNFSTDTWKKTPADRWMMSNDLLAQRSLYIGKSKQKIIDDLGVPDFDSPESLRYTIRMFNLPHQRCGLNTLAMIAVDLGKDGVVTDIRLSLD
jgi:hypothetical protein